MPIQVIKLRAAIDLYYEKDQTWAGYAEATKRSYRRSLDALITVTSSQLRVHELKVEHFDAALAYLRKGADAEEAAWRKRAGIAARGGRSEAQLGTDVKAYKALIKFLWRWEYMPYSKNPVGHMKSNPKSRDSGAPLHHMIVQPTEDIIERLLDEAGKRHPRDRMVVALGLFAAPRESEIVALKVGDVDFERDEIRMWRKKQRAWHVIPIHPRLREELKQYFAWLRKTHPVLDPAWYVIGARSAEVSRTKGGKLAGRIGRVTTDTPVAPTVPVSGVAADIVKAFKAAEVPDLYRPGAHTLRRMAAVLIEEVSGDRANAQALLGHTEGSSTDIYLRHRDATRRLREAYKQLPQKTGRGFGATDDCDVCEPEVPDLPSNVVMLRPRKVAV